MDDAEVKALLDGATPGPWRLRKAYLDDDAVEIVPRKVRGKASPEVGSWAELATVQIEYTDSTPKANARLIAAAPDLARALLDARAERDSIGAMYATVAAEREELEAELARLRADAQATNGVWQANLRLQAELADTQTQLGDWIVRADEANVKAEKAEAELAAAQQREAGLREALEFYGDKKAWTEPPVEVLNGEFGPAYRNQASEVRKDRGSRARAALSLNGRGE